MNSRQKISNPNKKDYKRLLVHYKFNEEDATNLQEIKNIISSSSKEFLDGFYEFILEFDYVRISENLVT